MSKHSVTRKGMVFEVYDELAQELKSCGIDVGKMNDGVRRKINDMGHVAGAKSFEGDVVIDSESKTVMQKVKMTLKAVEEKAKKSKSKKIKNLLQSLFKKKKTQKNAPKDDVVQEVEEPVLKVDVKVSIDLNGKSVHVIGFGVDSGEAEKLIAKGLAVDPS